MPTFTITSESIRARNRNILWGALFSVLLVAVVALAHQESPDRYNEALLWSVIGFVVLANLVNYYRHLRYLRLIRNHRVEVLPDSVEFWTAGTKSELPLSDVAGVFLHRRRGELRHIQVRLKNNRGIRLEGYGDLEGMAACLKERLSESQVVDNRG